MSPTHLVDPGDILEWMRAHFIVDAERGSLVWKLPPKNHGRLLGKEAGSLRPTHNGKRYCHVKRDRRVFKRGWLIFLWVNGRWPHPMLDHIDGNSENDAISNLRDATVSENARNHKGRKRRIQLPMGVRNTKHGRYQARISYSKAQMVLGSFATVEEAHSVYLAKRKELFGDFA